MIHRSFVIACLVLSCLGASILLPARAGDPMRIAQQAASPEAAQSPAPPTPAPAAPAVEPPLQKASPPKLEELLKPVGEISAQIEAAEAKVEEEPVGRKELAALRSEIEKIEFRAKEVAEALKPRLEEVHSQIAKLGAAPAADAPPEAPEIAAERNRLNALAAQIDGAIKKAGVIEVRAHQLVDRVQQARQGIFTRFLLLQGESPLRPQVWRTAADQLYLARRQIAFIATNWISIARLHWLGLLVTIAAALAAYVVLRTVMTRLIRSRLDAATTPTPTLAARASGAVWVTAAFALPPVAAVLVLYVGLDLSELLYWQVERLAQAMLIAGLAFILIASLARAGLQPKRGRWRLFDLDDASAARICLAWQTITGIYALDFLARRMVSVLSLPPSASIAAAFVASLLSAGLLVAIAGTRFVPRSLAPGAPVSRWRPVWLKALIVALAAALLATTLLGYVTLSRFIAGQLLMTGSGMLLVALLHIAIGGIRPAPLEAPERMDRALETRLRLGELGRARFLRGVRILLNVLLAVLAVPLFLLAWGLSGPEILSWARAAVVGFEVGGVRISLVRILVALLLFVTLLVATRLFQRWLAARALPRTRLDPGLANSIYTGAGYIGFAFALLVAVAYAGFDITSLAIVAGALSVGIGFGLQGIVNNFVSGLVLLVERPIKVGDWISIKEGEGYVRHIAVRATEIETFDRASLIVPNSELITQTVTNLTHRNQLGRLNISVRVSYASDPDLAREVLQQVAEANTSILRHPPPLVVLDNLGDQAMEYTVRVYLADINRSLQVQTEIRSEIVKALRAAGVDIPYFAVQIGHASGPRAAPERVSVKIATAPDADPDAVLQALGAAGRRCAGALTEPPPEAAFDNIGDGALEFSLSVAVAEGADAKRTETALRSAAVKALRSAGIALANRQQQLPLQELDELRSYLLRLMEERAGQYADADIAGARTPKRGRD